LNAASGQPSHAHQGCHPERSEGPVQLATAPAGLYAVPNPDGNAIADPRTAATHFPSPLVIPNPHAKRAGEGPYETCAAAWTRPGVPMLRAVPEDAIQFAPEPRPRSRTRFVRSLPCPPSSGRIGMTITLGLEAMRNPRQSPLACHPGMQESLSRNRAFPVKYPFDRMFASFAAILNWAVRNSGL